MNILEADKLVKVYGGEKNNASTKALSGISLKINTGEFVGIMGPSGSGKSTLLNLLSGIDKPTSGYVKINDTLIGTMDQNQLAIFRRQKMGFVFQDFNLMDSLTLKENVMLPMILDRKPVEFMERRAKEIMTLFDIYDIRNKYPYHISGGQQQRVAVSRAVINNPSVVFADEPTGNLDSKSSEAIMECFRKMNDELACTILVVTHDAKIASFSNRVIFIKDGNLCSQIVKKSTNNEFASQILNNLAVLGGNRNDL